MLFTSSKKQVVCDLKIQLNGKRFSETDSVKYLGIQIDKKLKQKQLDNNVALKLNKGDTTLSKFEHVWDIKILSSV